MGEVMDMTDELRGRRVSEIWWEGNDLHVVFADGSQEYYVFKDAYVTGMHHELQHDEGVLVEEMTLTAEKP